MKNLKLLFSIPLVGVGMLGFRVQPVQALETNSFDRSLSHVTFPSNTEKPLQSNSVPEGLPMGLSMELENSPKNDKNRGNISVLTGDIPPIKSNTFVATFPENLATKSDAGLMSEIDQQPGLYQDAGLMSEIDQQPGFYQDAGLMSDQQPGLYQDAGLMSDQQPGLYQDAGLMSEIDQKPGFYQDTGSMTEIFSRNPVSDAVSDPVPDTVSVPVSDPVSDAVSVPVSDPVPDPVSDPVSVPVSVPVSDEVSDGESDGVSIPVPVPVSDPQILSPTADTVLDVPATTVILQFPVGTEVELRVNGEPVDPELIGRTETSGNLVTQTWYGVPLAEGENILSVGTGNAESLQEMALFVRGTPTEITVETIEARVPADGRSIVTVRGQIKDESGHLSQRDVMVTLAASAGEFVGADQDTDQLGFQVQAIGGEYIAELRSPLDAQTVRIRASIPGQTGQKPAVSETPGFSGVSGLEAFTQMEFTTYLRPALVSGVVNFRLGRRGTDYFDNFKNFLPADENNEYETDLTGALFATGKIGDWLFTGAYNSDRSLNQGCDCDNGLFGGTQSRDLQYPTYGDGSTSQRTASSQDSVFLRLERSSPIPDAGLDYLMWGDYSTTEFANQSQEFSSLTRSLHGFKANYNLGALQFTGVYADNLEGFQRDTIPPDGTSGFYFLSQRLVIDGSENVFIEVEDVDRQGNVLQRQQMIRGEDYEIDYDRGTLFFRRPIQRTGVIVTNGNISVPVVYRIVATYQYENQDSSTNLYGGRLRYHLSRDYNSPVWLGGSYIRQDQGVRDFELYGADMLYTFGGRQNASTGDSENSGTSFNGQLSAEFAHSTNNSEILGLVTGEAYRVNFHGNLGPFNGRAYYRTADRGFANDTTVSFVPGQTRYGTQVNARLTNSTTARFSYDVENNWGAAIRPLQQTGDLLNRQQEALPGTRVDNSLETISVGLQQQIGRITTGLDWIHRKREDDQATNPLNVTSSQLRSHLTVPVTNSISLRAQNELNLSSNQDTVYPNRTILGADWRIAPGVTLGLNHQFFSGGQYRDNSITTLNLNGDYNLTENTVLTGRYSMVDTQAMSAAMGIKHGWNIRPGLRMDLAYEHVFGSIFGRSSTSSQFAQPFAPGQSAASLGVRGGDSYSIGLAYTDNPDFQASGRYEHRFSSAGNNTVITASANGKPTKWLTMMGRYQQASSSNQILQDLGDTINLRLGLAFRHPEDDRFNALLRYEYRQNPSTIPDSILFGTGTSATDHTFATELIYTPSWQWEFFGKQALRRSTSFLADDLVGTSLVSLSQLRATYRFAYDWDVAVEGRWIQQPEADYNEVGLVTELGFYLTPDLRLSAGYVFGEVSDRDFESDRSADGFYFGLTMKVNQLWPGFGQEPVNLQQESIETQQPPSFLEEQTQNEFESFSEVKNEDAIGDESLMPTTKKTAGPILPWSPERQ